MKSSLPCSPVYESPCINIGCAGVGTVVTEVCLSSVMLLMLLR